MVGRQLGLGPLYHHREAAFQVPAEPLGVKQWRQKPVMRNLLLQPPDLVRTVRQFHRKFNEGLWRCGHQLWQAKRRQQAFGNARSEIASL